MFEEHEEIIFELGNDAEEVARDAAAYKSCYLLLNRGIDALIENLHTLTPKQFKEALRYLQILTEDHFVRYGED